MEEVIDDQPTEMVEDAEMSSGEDSDDQEDKEEAQNLAKLAELDSALTQDPYHYQSHLDKIEVLKSMGELDRLREARETFAKAYPLAPEIWLSWLKDEQNLVSKCHSLPH